MRTSVSTRVSQDSGQRVGWFGACHQRMGDERASIAFEYVLVTLVGVGMSLMVMQYAKKMITSKLTRFQDEFEQVWEQSRLTDDDRAFDGF